MQLKEWLEENELSISVTSTVIHSTKAPQDAERKIELQLVGNQPSTTCLLDDCNWVINSSIKNEKDKTMPLVGYALMNMMGEIMGKDMYLEQLVPTEDEGPRMKRERLGTLVVPKSFECGSVVADIVSTLEKNCG